MFDLSRHGIAFNMMSTRVDFMADNIYYQNPADLLHWMRTELTPRVRLDHGYSMSWSWKIGQGVKVYFSGKRGIRDDDEKTVYGRFQGACCA